MDDSTQDDGLNVADFLLDGGRPEDSFLTTVGGTVTYADLHAAIARLSHDLAVAGLAPGARVGLLSRNSLFWVAAYLAIIRSGHTAVPFPTVLTPQDVVRRAELVGCETLLVESALQRRFPEVSERMRTIITDEVLADPASPPGPLPPAAPGAAEAVLMFTSGTTAQPRAVRVTHDNIRANTESILNYLALDRTDHMLVVLPLSYCYGASLLHTHLRVGAQLSLCETLTFPQSVVSMLAEHRCTGFAGVPSTYQLLLRASSFASTSLPNLRHLQQAGGRLPPAEVQEIAAAHPGARMFVMYGQTEATARLSYLPPEQLGVRPGSIGRGILGVTLRVTDEAGRDVAPGVVGEIRARGRSITPGYWQDPDSTAARYVDGELRTGDLARMDEDGYLYVVDRQEDFIKPWGHRVSSQEVEDVVLELAEVVSAAVVGRPDHDAGEAIVAFCTLRPGAELTPEDVARHCRSRLARHMVPHEIRIIDSMPLNPSGKVLKPALRTMAATPQ